MPKGWASRITTLVTPPVNSTPWASAHTAARSAAGVMAFSGGSGTHLACQERSPGPTRAPTASTSPSSPLGLVFAHRVDFDQDGRRNISPSEFHTILQLVIDSACSEACA